MSRENYNHQPPTTAANKLSTMPSSSKFSDESNLETSRGDCTNISASNNCGNDFLNGVTINDMATQWDAEILRNKWEPHIPALVTPKEDSTRGLLCHNTENNSQKQRRPNLFALSDEMSSNLHSTHQLSETRPSKPSLTLVSEYILNRALHLREPEITTSSKKQSKDLQTLKQTIIRTRPPKTKVNPSYDERLLRGNASGIGLYKKKCATMYNHCTKDTRDVPCADKQIVFRDTYSDKDAYSEALDEATALFYQEKQSNKTQDMTSKMAMTRQNVEKEYRDTMAFLNGLHLRNKVPKPINNVYKDDHRLQMQKESRQRALQHEFKNIEKESRQQGSLVNQEKSTLYAKSQHKKSKSPSGATIDDNINSRDFQYSWMPVPDCDGNLAVHTIPIAVKEGKSGNSVKFTKVDRYLEYRSRHKHTPPTKDANYHEKKITRCVNALTIQQQHDNSWSASSIAADTSSTEDLRLTPENNNIINEASKERILIYKILDYKNRKNGKSAQKIKLDATRRSKDIANEKKLKSANIEKECRVNKPNKNNEFIPSVHENPLSVENLDPSEGSDKMDSEKGKKCIIFKCRGVDKSTSSSHSLIIDPAINTSANSFKTATNIIPKSTLEEGGYIKLIDEDGRDKGNIFIGATGFLKDDAYEVVIQLRKKSLIKEDTRNHDEEVIKENLPSGKNTNNTEKIAVLSKFGNNIHSKATSTDQNPEQTKIENPHISTIIQDPFIVSNIITGSLGLNKKNGEQHPRSSQYNKDFPSARNNRSVSTLFRDLYAIPNTDPISRPATSSYTQTSLSSPNSRPTLIHMSSSTSTAYMSPPELVFPNSLRRGYESCNEAYQNINDEKHTNEYLSKIQSELEINRLKTPPNTARSLSTDVENDSLNIHKSKRDSTHPSPVSSIRCHKCKTKGNFKLCCKYNSKNKCQLLSNKKAGRRTKSAFLYSRKSKKSWSDSKSKNKSYLNHMLKKYIKKLLSLNQERIKVIQIVNQECSSVNAPASSIINVPSNVHRNTTDNNALKNEISLEQIKHFLRELVWDTLQKKIITHRNLCKLKATNFILKNIKSRRKHLKTKTHKVKSLNISKNIRINFCDRSLRYLTQINTSAKGTARNARPKSHNIISSTRNEGHRKYMTEETTREDTSSTKKAFNVKNKDSIANLYKHKSKTQYRSEVTSFEQPKTIISSGSKTPDSHVASAFNGNPTCQPINTCFQISDNINNDTNFMKLAEDKLKNMEKIADLAEKCTKRLSNLAKVIEDVRKNKSLAYSQNSTSDSTDYDKKSDKVVAEKNKQRPSNFVIDFIEKTEIKSLSNITPKDENEFDSTDYDSLLGISKPGYIKSTYSVDSGNKLCCDNIIEEAATKRTSLITTNVDYLVGSSPKCRNNLPPALLRVHLKRHQENIVPHELSTVIEVESPMIVKLKELSSNMDNANQSVKNSIDPRTENNFRNHVTDEELQINSMLRQSFSIGLNNSKMNKKSTDLSNESKLCMMDLNQFNEIMLSPFISLQQYAQDYHEDDMVSKRQSVSIDTGLIDNISTVHSDSSLGDVMAELLKRKLISESFQFDNASNLNSTTSSESTLSDLELLKARRDKSKSKILENKENIAKTSDNLSISSNPDLENAFKKLVMESAAYSTLKKSKEQLALSSSSNTSSSSLSQFKFKNSTKQDVLTTIKDSVLSVPNLLKKIRYPATSKNEEQQTSLTNSMTAKEFLSNELAKKITFSNKSSRNETKKEFLSLLETKMPDELKNSSRTIIEENSGDSIPNVNNNRARTSTPVQIFKSVTYHSSSTSNVSNGLFSNVDDLSSVKLTSTSMRNQFTSDKDELTIPNCSLKMRKGLSDCSKTDLC